MTNELLNYIEKIKEVYPTLRLGQMLCNLFNYSGIYYVTDAELLAALKRTYNVKADAAPITILKSEPESSTEVIPVKKPAYREKFVYLHKGEKIVKVFESEVQKYLDDGFERGRK